MSLRPTGTNALSLDKLVISQHKSLIHTPPLLIGMPAGAKRRMNDVANDVMEDVNKKANLGDTVQVLRGVMWLAAIEKTELPSKPEVYLAASYVLQNSLRKIDPVELNVRRKQFAQAVNFTKHVNYNEEIKGSPIDFDNTYPLESYP
eukprot:4126150-Prymnesium_polylepis.2